MTSYTYGTSGDNAILALSMTVEDYNGTDIPGNQYSYLFLQCDTIYIDGERMTKTSYLAGMNSYSTRLGKKKHSVTFRARVIKKSSSIGTDLQTVAKIMDLHLGMGAPWYLWVAFVDGGTTYYYPFSNPAGTFLTYLPGYIMRPKIELKPGGVIQLSGTFDECRA